MSDINSSVEISDEEDEELLSYLQTKPKPVSRQISDSQNKKAADTSRVLSKRQDRSVVIFQSVDPQLRDSDSLKSKLNGNECNFQLIDKSIENDSEISDAKPSEPAKQGLNITCKNVENDGITKEAKREDPAVGNEISKEANSEGPAVHRILEHGNSQLSVKVSSASASCLGQQSSFLSEDSNKNRVVYQNVYCDQGKSNDPEEKQLQVKNTVNETVKAEIQVPNQQKKSENAVEKSKMRYYLIAEKDWMSVCSKLTGNNPKALDTDGTYMQEPEVIAPSDTKENTSAGGELRTLSKGKVFKALKHYVGLNRPTLNVSKPLERERKSKGNRNEQPENCSEKTEETTEPEVEIVYVQLEDDKLKYEEAHPQSETVRAEDVRYITGNQEANEREQVHEKSRAHSKLKNMVERSQAEGLLKAQSSGVSSITNAHHCMQAGDASELHPAQVASVSSDSDKKPSAPGIPGRFVRVNNKLIRVCESISSEQVHNKVEIGAGAIESDKTPLRSDGQYSAEDCDDEMDTSDLDDGHFVAYPLESVQTGSVVVNFGSTCNLDAVNQFECGEPSYSQTGSSSEVNIQEPSGENNASITESPVVFRVKKSGSDLILMKGSDSSPVKTSPLKLFSANISQTKTANEHFKAMWQKFRDSSNSLQKPSKLDCSIENVLQDKNADQTESSDDDNLETYFHLKCNNSKHQTQKLPASVQSAATKCNKKEEKRPTQNSEDVNNELELYGINLNGKKKRQSRNLSSGYLGCPFQQVNFDDFERKQTAMTADSSGSCDVDNDSNAQVSQAKKIPQMVVGKSNATSAQINGAREVPHEVVGNRKTNSGSGSAEMRQKNVDKRSSLSSNTSDKTTPKEFFSERFVYKVKEGGGDVQEIVVEFRNKNENKCSETQKSETVKSKQKIETPVVGTDEMRKHMEEAIERVVQSCKESVAGSASEKTNSSCSNGDTDHDVSSGMVNVCSKLKHKIVATGEGDSSTGVGGKKLKTALSELKKADSSQMKKAVDKQRKCSVNKVKKKQTKIKSKLVKSSGLNKTKTVKISHKRNKADREQICLVSDENTSKRLQQEIDLKSSVLKTTEVSDQAETVTRKSKVDFLEKLYQKKLREAEILHSATKSEKPDEPKDTKLLKGKKPTDNSNCGRESGTSVAHGTRTRLRKSPHCKKRPQTLNSLQEDKGITKSNLQDTSTNPKTDGSETVKRKLDKSFSDNIVEVETANSLSAKKRKVSQKESINSNISDLCQCNNDLESPKEKQPVYDKKSTKVSKKASSATSSDKSGQKNGNKAVRRNGKKCGKEQDGRACKDQSGRKLERNRMVCDSQKHCADSVLPKQKIESVGDQIDHTRTEAELTERCSDVESVSNRGQKESGSPAKRKNVENGSVLKAVEKSEHKTLKTGKETRVKKKPGRQLPHKQSGVMPDTAWKEWLDDEAFKIDISKDHPPVNVNQMIRKILKSTQRKDSKGSTVKRKVKKNEIAESDSSDSGTRHRLTSESDDAWLSDSGPAGSFPAFKFSPVKHSDQTSQSRMDVSSDRYGHFLELHHSPMKEGSGKESDSKELSKPVDNAKKVSVSQSVVSNDSGSNVSKYCESKCSRVSASSHMESPISESDSPDMKKTVNKLRALLDKVNTKKTVKKLQFALPGDASDSENG